MDLNVEKINNSLVLQSITLQELAEQFGVTKKQIINYMREEGFTYDSEEGFFIKNEDLNQDLLKRVKELEKQQEEILELLCNIPITTENNTCNNISNNNCYRLELEIPPIEEIVQKSYKLSKNTAENFSQFCKEHREYKVQDLVTLALEDFLKKYQ